jgi:hypothetical protein
LEYLDLLVFKEGSTEVEWHVWGKGPPRRPDSGEYRVYAVDIPRGKDIIKEEMRIEPFGLLGPVTRVLPRNSASGEGLWRLGMY